MFRNLTVAECIAAFSAFSIAIAVARIIGFFAPIDITLIGLIDMSDVLALAFYESPLAMITILVNLAVFGFDGEFLQKKAPDPKPDIEGRTLEELDAVITRLENGMW